MSPLSSLCRASSNRKKRRFRRGTSPSRSLSAGVRLSVERLEDRTLPTASWLGNLPGPDGLQALMAPAIAPDGNAAVVWDGAVHHAVAGQWVARFSGVSGTPDDQMRTMFAYLRAMTAPTSLFAAPEDWSDPALNDRIERAAFELALLMESGFARKIKDESWQSYQHEYGSAGGTETSIDLDTDLMRLATGGSAA